jgi:hypothetical protein
MQTGDIFRWQTSKAKGYEKRWKFHIALCLDAKESLFLFINSENYYGEGYLLKQTDYPAFLTHDSYVGCTQPIRYSQRHLSSFSSTDPVGRLLRKDIEGLNNHLKASEVMEQRYIQLISSALLSALESNAE